jgi:uncharacterized membrane protein (UPF0127 family)
MMKITIRNSVIEAEEADSFFKRMMGLSFTKRKNMLFTMSFADRWTFWMFGVRYPLYIIFLSKEKEVVDVKRADPLSFSPKTWRTYTPKKACKYVLEVPADSNLKIKAGDVLSW